MVCVYEKSKTATFILFLRDQLMLFFYINNRLLNFYQSYIPPQHKLSVRLFRLFCCVIHFTYQPNLIPFGRRLEAARRFSSAMRMRRGASSAPAHSDQNRRGASALLKHTHKNVTNKFLPLLV